MTKTELCEALDAAGIGYPTDATKAELEALYDGLTPSAVVQRSRPVHMTRLEARAWSTR